jgi:hypothetical protein
MAHAHRRLHTVVREAFNPLRLLDTKEAIVPAMGHRFDEALHCNRCGRSWTIQRAQPRDCGLEMPEPIPNLVA